MDASSLDLELLNARFEAAPPREILEWAIERYWPAITMSSSFQTQSIPLLHMIAQIKPELPIYFLDTGYHFPETLHFKDMLQKRLGLNIVILQKEQIAANEDAQPGEPLYRTDPDKCCFINKVEPMRKVLQNMRAWITGIRREQTAQRAQANILELQSNGLVKINPLLNWTKQDLWQYIRDHNLPLHPLFAKGYLSVGCVPCTGPVSPGEGERAGRWPGTDKTECGLQTMSF